jgi:hypothetical protein
MRDPFEQLDEAIAAAGSGERAALIVGLAGRLAGLGAKLGETQAERLLEVEEASERWKIRKRTLWSWSRSKSAAVWAVRVGPHSMRIRALAFEGWLAERSAHLTQAKAHRSRTKRRAEVA